MAALNHVTYLFFSILFTIYVGRSLYANGQPFLLECWGNPKVADAVNRCLLIGFYLLNGSFVLLALRFGATGTSLEESLEILSGRVGFVVLVMGVMHFNNLLLCEWARRRRVAKHA